MEMPIFKTLFNAFAGAVAGLLLVAVWLISSYEVAVVYVKTADYESTRYSPSGFFFGLSAIAMALNMLPICKMVFHRGGIDVDEWIRKAYMYARRGSIEIGPPRAPPEPPDPVVDPNLHRKKRGQVALYLISVLILIIYSIAYWGTSKVSRWLGFVTGGAVLVLDGVVGAAVFEFNLVESRIVALGLASTYRGLLISFGVSYWYLGHCLAYTVVGSSLLCAQICRYFPVTSLGAARVSALADTVRCLRRITSSHTPTSAPQESNPELTETSLRQPPRHVLELEKTSSNTAFLEGLTSEQTVERETSKWTKGLMLLAWVIAGTPLRVWVFLTLVFVFETALVGAFPLKAVRLINDTHEQFQFGLCGLLVPPVLSAITAHVRALRISHLSLTLVVIRTGVLATFSFSGAGVLLAFLTNSSIILAAAICLPVLFVSLSVGAPIWVQNGCQFFRTRPSRGLGRTPSSSATNPFSSGDITLDDNASNEELARPESSRTTHRKQDPTKKQDFMMVGCLVVGLGAILSIGFIISKEPLRHGNRLVRGPKEEFSSTPYSEAYYYGWAIAAGAALVISSALPILAWFRTYRFTRSSFFCILFSIVVLISFCIGSFLAVTHHRPDDKPKKVDILISILPLVSIPAILSLSTGLYKWRDDLWELDIGTKVLVGFGVALLFAASIAVAIIIKPYTVGVALLLLLLLLLLALCVTHRWAQNNFTLTKSELFSFLFLALLLAIGSLALGWVADKPFIGASVGYFMLMILICGWGISVLLKPIIVVYSPRVLPVFVYDADKDQARDVSWAVLSLYGVVLGTAGWGVIASLNITPPYAGAAVTAVTIVAAFAFAVSRPRLTRKMMEDAIHYLPKETIVQAIAQATAVTQGLNAGVVTRRVQKPFGSGDLHSTAERAVDESSSQERLSSLPRGDIRILREMLRAEERAAGPWCCSCFRSKQSPGSHEDVASGSQTERKLSAHARILALEEAIDSEWSNMWGTFGGYLLLIIGLAARAERTQDEARLRRFLEDIGYGDVSVDMIKKWTLEEKKSFEEARERYVQAQEAEESELVKRRSEADAGKARRRSLLEQSKKKRKEAEDLVASIEGIGQEEAQVIAAAVRAMGEEDVAKPMESEVTTNRTVSRMLTRIVTQQRKLWAKRTQVSGCVCLVDGRPSSGGKVPGYIDPSVTHTTTVTISAAIHMTPPPLTPLIPILSTSGPRHNSPNIPPYNSPKPPLNNSANTPLNKSPNTPLDFALEMVIIDGFLGLKSRTSDGYNEQWVVGETNLVDGHWHCTSLVIDSEGETVSACVDGALDGWVPGVKLPGVLGGAIWTASDSVWVGREAQVKGVENSQSGTGEGLQVKDVFLWGRLLSEEELWQAHSTTEADTLQMQPAPLPTQTDNWDSKLTHLSSLDKELETFGERSSLGEGSTKGGAGGGERLKSLSSRKRKEAQRGDEIEQRVKQQFREEPWHEINLRMLAVEDAVKEALAERGEVQFTDAEFPPGDNSLFIDASKPLKKLQAVKKWTRSEEAISTISPRGSTPVLFDGPPNPADVCQGRLGDCWFLSAVAVLTEERNITQLLVTPEYNSEGIYTIRFNIQGVWTPVVVDDWIPVDKRGKPAFATSKKGLELWVMLLEKAYAKLHGSYEALEGGVVQDALVDLTGGAGEEIDIASSESQIDLASGRLWKQLLRFKHEGFLLGAGSPSGSDTEVSAAGIVQGHAYSILQICEVDGHQLLQIRNPWANDVEWNGPWSDNSPEWTERMRYKLKYSPRPSDGVFWMAWQDFQLHFRSVYVCRIYPPEMRYSVHGAWEGAFAGGCSNFTTWANNPQFLLKAQGPDSRVPIHVFITLTQGVHGSARNKTHYGGYTSSADAAHYYIGLRILCKNGGRASPTLYAHEVVGGSDYVNTREVACEIVLEPYPPGYTIIPTTYAPGEEGSFVLSVFTKASIHLAAIQP